MDKGLTELAEWIQERQWPALTCPYCAGALVIGDIQQFESRSSKEARQHPFWEADWIVGRFLAPAACHSCGEPVLITGDFKVGPLDAPDGEWRGEYENFYRVTATSPGLRLATLPDDTPPGVVAAFGEAAAVLWISPSSAANALRRGVEAFLDAKRVKKMTYSKGKRPRLKTHDRILHFKATNPEVADALMAVKWIGNDGSHTHALTVPEVLKGAEMFEYALDLAYGTRAATMRRRIAKVNKAKGAGGLVGKSP